MTIENTTHHLLIETYDKFDNIWNMHIEQEIITLIKQRFYCNYEKPSLIIITMMGKHIN